MSDTVKVSVVIPVYNVEKYMEQCIDSVRSQTYRNLEIILVDDGAADSSPRICDRYAEADERIRVIHKANGGLSDARNYGIDRASGDYITFVDSDDFLSETCIQTMLSHALASHCDMVCMRCVRCGESEHYGKFRIKGANGNSVRLFEGVEKMREFLTGEAIGTTAWGKLYRMTLFKNIRYPVGKLHEDVYTTYLLVDAAEKIASVDEIGYVYRQNASGITGSFSEKRFHMVEGKLIQATYIEKKYPDLRREAYAGVIYGCNHFLSLMARNGYFDREKIALLQSYYRKYWKCYVSCPVSPMGKLFCVCATLNASMFWRIIRGITFLAETARRSRRTAKETEAVTHDNLRRVH